MQVILIFIEKSEGTIHFLRQQKDWVGLDNIMASFADIQYCIYADIVGGSEKYKIMLT